MHSAAWRPLVPRQLPAQERIPDDGPEPDALTRLRARTESLAIVTIPVTGAADHGTLALARYWAHRSAADFPDGQLHLDLRGTDPAGPLDPSDGLRSALLALGLPEHLVPPGLDRRSAWFRRLLNGKRVLILLADAVDERQVRPFLPDGVGSLLIVTAPSRLDGLAANHGAMSLRPDRLTETEALVLLTAYLGADRIAGERAAARVLITRCGHRPQALGILAAQAIRRPGPGLRGLLRDLDAVSGDPADGGTGTSGASADDGLSAALSLCYQALSEPGAAMLRGFGLVDGPDLGVDALAALLDRSAVELAAPLHELIAANVLGEHRPGRYRCPGPVRRFARNTSRRTDSAADRRSARHRLLRYYRDTSAAAESLFRVPGSPPATPAARTFADAAAALAWWDVERINLVHAVAQAERLGFHRLAIDLARSLTTFWQLRHHPADWLHTHRTALRAADTVQDREAEAALHFELAAAYRLLGLGAALSTPESRTPQQQSADPEPSGPLTEGRRWHELGERCAEHGEFPAAIQHFERAVDVRDRTGNVMAATESLFRLGRTAFADGDPILARESFRQAESRYLDRCAERLAEVHRILTDLDDNR